MRRVTDLIVSRDVCAISQLECASSETGGWPPHGGLNNPVQRGFGMSAEIESQARMDLAKVLPNQPSADQLMLDADMADEYGLTSLNKVLFLMSVCDDTGVSVSAFTEPDVARMRTLADVVAALSEHAGPAA